MLRSVFLFAVLALFGVQSASADTWVNPYQRNDGTQVQGHWRSDADGNPHNNWSTKGNQNPHTGKYGTRTVPDSFYNRDSW
jgi:hypothetical protein